MALKRMVLEIGMGNDLHGGDYTKAAVRAVQDAIHHSSLTMIKSLGISPEDMHVEVTVGVQDPTAVDTDAVAKTLPYGRITVNAESGGLDVPTDAGDDRAVIATAAIIVRVDLP
tara:strand:- start:3519 stop:3860 length:342 start_codon:yes stop_codon:yes gene_type:complete